MIQIALASLVVTVIAGVFALGVLEIVSPPIAKILFVIFLAVFVISLLLHLTGAIDKTDVRFPFRERKDLPPRERRRRM